jgi:PadR family transcriptional regulator AphA
MSTAQLTPTSYLVLGLLAREGASTPYELKHHVAATLGNFWSFPHTLLYGEPSRLAGLGLLSERREEAGRRRRIFTITQSGRDALRAWLARPSEAPTELRDPGLLQLFFADLGPPEARSAIADQQLAIHRAKLADYEEDQRAERGPRGGGPGHRTAERWRGETVRMGLLYERAALDFWAGVAGTAGPPEVVAARAPADADDDGAGVPR